ncbi:MAG: hypothetical protein IT334_09035 [Thermomicrobiales bacterium]|nr:hypothetical protein [Thermomicrobiales bacterium]
MSVPTVARAHFTRRALIAAPPLAMLGLVAQRLTFAQDDGLVSRGDCTDEPALRMLLDFQTNNLDRLPYRTLDDVLPGVDWQLVNSPDLGAFFVPGDWTPLVLWANAIDDRGVPEWQQEQPRWPFWSAVFVVSPDQTSAWISVQGAVDGPPYLDADALMSLARTTIMGSDERGRELCAVGRHDSTGLMGNVLFAFGDRYGSDLFCCRGYGIPSEAAGPSFGPGTAFGFDAMIAPRRQSEETMRDVFIRILWQFLPKPGGGESTPTPTPTPGF